ncbi:FkbM family methyltransferase [Xanthomonas sp. JAI131]|jgi:FkbM family methyltransferase|uniref:FkbM family methyltransferase n=1 Tax=Xanthomonas sp. JAI131 TaxID=2723067 RepID=UPI0017AE45B3|nr:FkbM family methyltransferase [Xanthomonas sp. JAI131]NYF19289.1 FkbM family methyltransferase [Xanthomonas sp. JAI131]
MNDIAALRSDPLDALAKARAVFFLAPSSHIGSIHMPQVLVECRQRFPGIRLVAVDDMYHAAPGMVEGYDQILPVADYVGEPHSVAVNCGHLLATWLYFDHLAKARQGSVIDLPELLYAFDMVLVYQNGKTTRAQTLEHAERFSALKRRFADAHSVDTLDAVLRMRMTGDRAHLLDVICPSEQEYFSMYRSELTPITLHDSEHYVDIGAYDGDTLRKFLTAARHRYRSIHAFEPDPSNFAALQQRMGSVPGPIFLHNQAVGNSDQPLSFSAKGNMGSRVEVGGDIQVPSVRLDDVLDEITLLKMDVEGFEAQVLLGGAQVIGRCRPRMAITCYHHALDLLDIVAVLDRIYPDARLRLRHYAMFFYDTILYVE